MKTTIATLREYMISSTLDREAEIKKIIGWVPEALDLVSQAKLPVEFRLILGCDDNTRGTLEDWMKDLRIRKETIPNKKGPIDGFYAALIDPSLNDVPVHLYLDAGQFNITDTRTLEGIAIMGDEMLRNGFLYGNLSRTNINLAYNQVPSQMREIDEILLALLIQNRGDVVINPYKLKTKTTEARVFDENNLVESTSASAALNSRHPRFVDVVGIMEQDSKDGLLNYFACEYHLATLGASVSPRVTSWVETEPNYFPPNDEAKEIERARRLIGEKGKVAKTSIGNFLRERFSERRESIRTLLSEYYPTNLIDDVMQQYGSFLN